MLNAAQPAKRERDATSCLEYLVCRFADLTFPGLLDEHLGVEHERRKTVADFVNRRLRCLAESGEPCVVGVPGIRRVTRVGAFNLSDEARRGTGATAGCRHRNTDPDVLPILAHVALDELITANIGPSKTTPLSGFGFEIVCMGDVARIQTLQLTACEAKH